MGRPAGREARAFETDRPATGDVPVRPATESVTAESPAPTRMAPPRPAVGSRTPMPPRPAAPAAPAAAPKAPAVTVTPVVTLSPVETKTVREILPPWHVLQEKLQSKTTVAVPVPRDEALNQEAQLALVAQEAAAANWMPAHAPSSSSRRAVDSSPPSSGVRLSEHGPAAPAVGLAPASTPDSLAPSTASVPVTSAPPAQSPLSFKVYTLDDLERRAEMPLSHRFSRVAFDAEVSRRQRWTRAGHALQAFAFASLAWVKTQGERPNPKVALRQPFDDLGDALQVVVDSIDWRRLGVTTGSVVGAALTILFAVLTVAELTDDVKAPRSAHLANARAAEAVGNNAPLARGVAPASSVLAAPPVAAAVEPPAAVPAAAVPAASVTSLGELDDPEPEAAPVKKPAKRTPAAPPKAKAPKLSLRTAPF